MATNGRHTKIRARNLGEFGVKGVDRLPLTFPSTLVMTVFTGYSWVWSVTCILTLGVRKTFSLENKRIPSLTQVFFLSNIVLVKKLWRRSGQGRQMNGGTRRRVTETGVKRHYTKTVDVWSSRKKLD